MFLSLEQPADKQISLFARNLSGEEKFERGGFTPFDSDRDKFETAMETLNRSLGAALPKPMPKAFHTLFNQYSWKGTSGFEYWTKTDEGRVLALRHALKVAEELAVPLHVHQDVLVTLIDPAFNQGLTFDWQAGTPVELLHPGDDMPFINRQLSNGTYYRLTDVVIPPALVFGQ